MHRRAFFGLTAQKTEDKAADRVKVLMRQGQAQMFVQVVNAHAGIHAVHARLQRLQERLFLIVLILNVPDQFFQQVFHRHQTRRAAVFILHNGEQDAGTPELVQKRIYALVFGDNQRQAHDRAQV